MAITVNVVQFGKESQIDLPDGATYGDLSGAIPNAKNLDIRSGGTPIAEKAKQAVRPNERLTAAPRQVKQGS